jgi:hypothetical protein
MKTIKASSGYNEKKRLHFIAVPKTENVSMLILEWIASLPDGECPIKQVVNIPSDYWGVFMVNRQDSYDARDFINARLKT